MTSFHEIPHGSPFWDEILIHRDRILRRPLGLTLSPDDTINEETQRHFILRKDGKAVAGLITCPPEGDSIRLRQMWVHEGHEGNGLGRHLLGEVADLLFNEGVRVLSLHARVPVQDFYKKCGYQAIGDIFTEIGIPHIRMTRQLTPPAQSGKNA